MFDKYTISFIDTAKEICIEDFDTLDEALAFRGGYLFAAECKNGKSKNNADSIHIMLFNQETGEYVCELITNSDFILNGANSDY